MAWPLHGTWLVNYFPSYRLYDSKKTVLVFDMISCGEYTLKILVPDTAVYVYRKRVANCFPPFSPF